VTSPRGPQSAAKGWRSSHREDVKRRAQATVPQATYVQWMANVVFHNLLDLLELSTKDECDAIFSRIEKTQANDNMREWVKNAR
jgi:hypothetical protein